MPDRQPSTLAVDVTALRPRDLDRLSQAFSRVSGWSSIGAEAAMVLGQLATQARQLAHDDPERRPA